MIVIVSFFFSFAAHIHVVLDVKVKRGTYCLPDLSIKIMLNSVDCVPLRSPYGDIVRKHDLLVVDFFFFFLILDGILCLSSVLFTRDENIGKTQYSGNGVNKYCFEYMLSF